MSSALERALSSLLTRYIELDPEQLKASVWSGHIVLTDAKLRHDALRADNLCVVSGRIGRLAITVPWKTLAGGGTVEVDVRDVVLRLRAPHDLEQQADAAEALQAASAARAASEVEKASQIVGNGGTGQSSSSASGRGRRLWSSGSVILTPVKVVDSARQS